MFNLNKIWILSRSPRLDLIRETFCKIQCGEQVKQCLWVVVAWQVPTSHKPTLSFPPFPEPLDSISSDVEMAEVGGSDETMSVRAVT